ncbi:MAG TPA: helix-turn-helix transcriptional regulator [Geminicoccaceae bacterium]|nr:helix-turn-helix transcriptional regulator [Geminicoccaceae bacterium]
MSDRSKRVDRHVGERIRLRRTELGLTQEQLGEALQVSYQQIQKYETGANRISAGRLYEIARRLGIDVGDFFAGLDIDADEPPGGAVALEHGGRQRSAIELVRKFGQIQNPEVRACIAGLVKTIVERHG